MCVVSVVQDLFGKYSPDELEEHRREINEPRRRPERDKNNCRTPKSSREKSDLKIDESLTYLAVAIKHQPPPETGGTLNSRRPQPAEQRQPPTPWQNQRFAGATRWLREATSLAR